jgi:hypothetical protein
MRSILLFIPFYVTPEEGSLCESSIMFYHCHCPDWKEWGARIRSWKVLDVLKKIHSPEKDILSIFSAPGISHLLSHTSFMSDWITILSSEIDIRIFPSFSFSVSSQSHPP